MSSIDCSITRGGSSIGVFVLEQAEGSPWTLRMSHPGGVLAVTLHREGDAVIACEVQRAARVLMRGAAHGVAPPVSTACLGEASA
jgi:2-methylaconitate cis-trans-isomerase PrpF